MLLDYTDSFGRLLETFPFVL